VVRLVCKDVFHRSCLRSHLVEQSRTTPTKDLKCPGCSGLLVDATTQPRSKLRDAVASFVAQLDKVEEREPVLVPPAPTSSPSPTPSATTSSSYASTGAVSRAQQNEQRHEPEVASTRHSASSYSSASSSSSSSAAPHDLESQLEDTSKTSKKPNRFMAMRNASKGGLKRWCRPQRIILVVMALALLLVVGMYVRFSMSLMSPLAPSSSSTPPTATDQLSAEIVNAD
jgi:cobalamin biosynthesis Mg chelatase CobN